MGKKLDEAIARIEAELRTQRFDPHSPYAQGARQGLRNARAICRDIANTAPPLGHGKYYAWYRYVTADGQEITPTPRGNLKTVED